jgi:hypothetical protein
MKLLNVEITPEQFSFIQAVKEVNDEFTPETTEPVFLIGLSQEQCAQLKEVFEKAKRYEIMNGEPLEKLNDEKLYQHIYLQIAANKNLLK